jgi:hypothetical protein
MLAGGDDPIRTEAPEGPDVRIDFSFIDAGFDLTVLPFRLPYPVPFRLLGDEVRGRTGRGGC